MLHVVQIARRFEPSAWGGTETAILETSRRLIARGHDTEILSSLALSQRREEEVGGVRVRRTRYFYPYLGLTPEARARLDQKAGNLFSFEAMYLLARRRELDLLHLHTGKRLGGIARTVARRRGVPYVVTLHGGHMDVGEGEASSWTAPTRGALEWGKILGMCVGSRRVLEDAAAVLCLGPEEQRRVQARLPAQRVEYLPHGVDPGRFATGDGARFRRRLGLPASARILLCVGRIDGQKNQRLAIDLLPGLLADHPDLHLALAGSVTDAAYDAALKAQVESLGLASRVHFVGQLAPASPELADAYHGAEMLVLPSIHEPFGIVILEAWAAGLPVVASRVGGIPSFLRDGVDGLLASPGDLPAWHRAVDGLLRDRARRRELGGSGRERANGEYSWDHLTSRLERIYGEVLDDHPVRP